MVDRVMENCFFVVCAPCSVIVFKVMHNLIHLIFSLCMQINKHQSTN